MRAKAPVADLQDDFSLFYFMFFHAPPETAWYASNTSPTNRPAAGLNVRVAAARNASASRRLTVAPTTG